jgi:hypothetical protein
MANRVWLYNTYWEPLLSPVTVEATMIRKGGQYRNKDNGLIVGNGLFFHFKRFISMVWPEHAWHKWSELALKTYLENKIIGVIGPASSGKTHDAAIYILADFYVWHDCTTVLVCSTEREMLELRIFGEVKKWHQLAKVKFPELVPGNLIESRQRIITDSKFDADDGRDFRNGICGVPCRRGGHYQGLGSFSGVKNKRLRLVADEAMLMPRIFVDSIANLGKNTDFKAIVLGNPKDPLDALGIVCEPSATVGGWESNIDQTPETKTWPTRFDGGICIQLPGSDSPNLDGKLGIPLITQEQIDADVKFFGRDSVNFSMMNQGCMPRGQGLRRVITRQQCLKFGAMDEAIWKNDRRTRIGGLDASYSAIGEGDRTIFIEVQFGEGVNGEQLLAMIDVVLVPINATDPEIPEDQVALFVKNQCEQRDIFPENMFFDSTGRGTLMSAFARLWSPNVVPIEFGGKPTEQIVSSDIRVTGREYYGKRVSQLWFAVAHTIQASQFRGMTEEVMLEGCAREWGFTASNKIDIESKNLTKAKTGRSPDLFDALAVAVEGAVQRGFIIKRKVAPAALKHDEGWKNALRGRMERLEANHRLNYTI